MAMLKRVHFFVETKMARQECICYNRAISDHNDKPSRTGTGECNESRKTNEIICFVCILPRYGGGVAAFAGEPPSTYELYQNVYNKDGSSPLVDAKWWKDESGVMGAGGVIHALPGTYDDGFCDVSSEATQSRAHLRANTLLVSTVGDAL